MNTEFEVTFANINREKVIEKIKSLGGSQSKENTLMKRVIFENQANKRGSYLRVRDEGNGKITCTYKEEKNGEPDIYSIKELETEVKDFDIMVNIFRKLNIREKSYQETYREIWEINNEIEIMFDLWPGLNLYIEIEGKNEKIVKKYTELLGFNYKDGIFGTSFQIYEKELGLDFDYINSLEEITFRNPPTK